MNQYQHITPYLIECIKNNIPVTFVKYGDGEYNCINSIDYYNCDRDTYTHNLREGLKNSFQNMVNSNNVYVGKWHTETSTQFWESIAKKQVNWSNYHSLIFENEDISEKTEHYYDIINLYKSIKQSPLKKIIICNESLVKSKSLLNINYMINVPYQNWFDEHYQTVINYIKSIVVNNEPHIIIFCCGMGGKVIIGDLLQHFSSGIYLDFGSGLDLICTKHGTRGWQYTYESLLMAFKDIIPEDWDDEKYNNIYEQAKLHTGMHLSK